MFEYLLEKILKSDFKDQPFKHIEIKNFFNKDDFQNILKQSEIKFPSFTYYIQFFRFRVSSYSFFF